VLTPPAFILREPREFVTVPVSRGDVRLFTSPSAQYMLVIEEDVRFDETGIPLYDIFVSVGDRVHAGDIIAALGGGHDLQEERGALINIRNEIMSSLTQLNQRHELALALAEASGNPVDDLHFRDQRADILGELEIIDLQLSRLAGADESRYLLSPITGLVTQALTFTEGMTSTAGRRIATISDESKAAFVVSSPIAATMHPKDLFEIILNNNTYLLEVIDPHEYGITGRSEWTTVAFLTFVDTPPMIPLNTRVIINILYAESLDVLYIPDELLRQAGERTFVYVLENGLRTIREVTIGLWGNNTIEIISGLEEGELLIR